MTTQISSAHEILHRLDSEILIFDGATGTYLQQHGLESGGCPELMNADAPDTIRQMARDYFDAGSDFVPYQLPSAAPSSVYSTTKPKTASPNSTPSPPNTPSPKPDPANTSPVPSDLPASS